MTSDAHRLLDRLRGLGVALAADGGDGLAYDAPAGAMTDALAAEVRRHKLALLAILTGLPVASGVAGIVWDPRGGVRLADPPDLRELCLRSARARGWPRLPLRHRPAEAVAAGEAAWRAFASTSTVADLLFALDASAESPGTDFATLPRGFRRNHP